MKGWSRRSFISTLAALWGSTKVHAVTALGQSADYGTQSTSARPRLTGLGSTGNIYAELGVIPVINAAGTYTVLGGSLMAPEVFEAMQLGNDGFVNINELEVAAGKKMAELCKMPPGYTGLVTGGASAEASLKVGILYCCPSRANSSTLMRPASFAKLVKCIAAVLGLMAAISSSRVSTSTSVTRVCRTW